MPLVCLAVLLEFPSQALGRRVPRGWVGSTLHPLDPRSVPVPLPLPEPRSYVESVVRTAVAGPRTQEPEPKSFSAPAACLQCRRPWFNSWVGKIC